jgi:hypothetical protein
VRARPLATGGFGTPTVRSRVAFAGRYRHRMVPKGHSLPSVANRAAERMTSPYRSQKRTSAAKAVKRQAMCDTAEAAPFVRQSLPWLLGVSEGIMCCSIGQLKKSKISACLLRLELMSR